MEPITICLLFLAVLIAGEVIFITLNKLLGEIEGDDFGMVLFGKLLSIIIALPLVIGFYYSPIELWLIILCIIILIAIARLNQLWLIWHQSKSKQKSKQKKKRARK